jgi:hypothetical protein
MTLMMHTLTIMRICVVHSSTWDSGGIICNAMQQTGSQELKLELDQIQMQEPKRLALQQTGSQELKLELDQIQMQEKERLRRHVERNKGVVQREAPLHLKRAPSQCCCCCCCIDFIAQRTFDEARSRTTPRLGNML